MGALAQFVGIAARPFFKRHGDVRPQAACGKKRIHAGAKITFAIGQRQRAVVDVLPLLRGKQAVDARRLAVRNRLAEHGKLRKMLRLHADSLWFGFQAA